MKRLIRRKIEAWLILLAVKILIDRNVQRSAVVSRRDNNDMWAMAEQLEAIAKRISKSTRNPPTPSLNACRRSAGEVSLCRQSFSVSTRWQMTHS